MFHGSLLDAQNAGVMGRTLNLHRFYWMHKQKTNITINVLLHSKGALKLMNISQLESVFEDSKNGGVTSSAEKIGISGCSCCIFASERKAGHRPP